MHFILEQYESTLNSIDIKIKDAEPDEIPQLFSKIPLDVFGALLLDVPEQYKNIKNYFPTMPADKIQSSWAGNSGIALLVQTCSFVKDLMFNYLSMKEIDLYETNILDYGCGWGRMIRLLYKYFPYTNIYGVDAWDQSLDICRNNNLLGNLSIVDYLPNNLPFQDIKFDLIISFSVFTHLSRKCQQSVLSVLRKRITDNGLLALSIRLKQYWSIRKDLNNIPEIIREHDRTGFAFVPHNRPPINGDITYGDASMTMDYIHREFKDWKIVNTSWSLNDQHQFVVYLQPG